MGNILTKCFLCVLFFGFSTLVMANNIFQYVDENGKVVFTNTLPPDGAKVISKPEEKEKKQDGYTTKNPHPDYGIDLDISEDTVKECYASFRRVSLDPSTAKMIGYKAKVAPDGTKYISVDAVFANKFGGPDRHSCYCRLNDAMQIDENKLKKDTFDYYLKARGEEEIRRNIMMEEIKKNIKS